VTSRNGFQHGIMEHHDAWFIARLEPFPKSVDADLHDELSESIAPGYIGPLMMPIFTHPVSHS
jgi:hypothetical protein